ncbi:MAG: hypothetical protein WA624_13760 [Methylocella sp.]
MHSLTCGRAANKDVILGEDGTTNNSDTAPRNDFSLTSFARQTLKPVSASPTRAIAHPPVLPFSRTALRRGYIPGQMAPGLLSAWLRHSGA